MSKLWRGGQLYNSAFISNSCPSFLPEHFTLHTSILPNCLQYTFQVFAFVKSDQSKQSPHRSECHVCESFLEFRAKVEVVTSIPHGCHHSFHQYMLIGCPQIQLICYLQESISTPRSRWVHGRVYLIRRRRRPQGWI